MNAEAAIMMLLMVCIAVCVAVLWIALGDFLEHRRIRRVLSERQRLRDNVVSYSSAVDGYDWHGESLKRGAV